MSERSPAQPVARRCLPGIAWGWALVFVVAFAAHARTLDGDFVFDDGPAILENPVVQGSVGPGAALSRDYWGGHRVGTWRPLSVLSLRLDWVLGGGSPWTFHLTNMLLHALACLALALAVGRATGRPWFGVGTALLYAVLAVNTEAVASAVGRADLLAAALCWCAWALLGREGGALRVGLAGLAFLGALLSKESVLVFPVVLFVFDALLRSSWPRPWAPRYLVLVGALVTYFALHLWLYGGPGEVFRAANNNPLLTAPFDERLWTSFRLFLLSVRLVLVPLNLSADYSYAQILPDPHPGSIEVLAGIAAVGACIYAGWRWRRSQPLLAAALGGFLLCWAPLANLVVVLPVALAERLLYFPAAFAAMLLAGLVPATRARWRRVVLAGVILLGIANLTRGVFRDGDWHDELRLFRATVRTSPKAARGWVNLAAALLRRGRRPEAVAALRRAGEIAPAWGLAHALMGATLDEEGRTQEAYEHLRQAMAYDPRCGQCARYLATFLVRHRRFNEAVRVLRAVLARNPHAAKARVLLRRIERDRRRSAPAK